MAAPAPTIPETLETASPQEVLAWATETYRARAIMTTSFGIESAVLLHMATRVAPDLPVVFLNTGLLFPETLEYRDRLARRLGLNLRVYEATPEQVAAVRRHLADPANRDGTCCDAVKVELMRQALIGADCWIAGLRREQSPTRARTPVLRVLEDGVVKVHPLAAWTTARAHAYMKEHDLPFHPLWYQGYTSVGCAPCTKKPLDARDPRSGRWPGLAKTECGLHGARRPTAAGHAARLVGRVS